MAFGACTVATGVEDNACLWAYGDSATMLLFSSRRIYKLGIDLATPHLPSAPFSSALSVPVFVFSLSTSSLEARCLSSSVHEHILRPLDARCYSSFRPPLFSLLPLLKSRPHPLWFLATRDTTTRPVQVRLPLTWPGAMRSRLSSTTRAMPP